MASWVQIDGVFYNNDIIRKIYIEKQERKVTSTYYEIIIETNRYDCLADQFDKIRSKRRYKSLREAEHFLNEMMGYDG